MKGAAMLVLPKLLWKPSPNFSLRGARVSMVVVHDCEGSYEGAVSWFSQARSRVSAHIVLSADGLEATQMVAWDKKAWAVCDFNSMSESIEAAGFSAKGLGAPEWAALAGVVAFRLKANGLPCQQANEANYWTGFCQHADLGEKGGGHHDITQNRDIWTTFAEIVEKAFNYPLPAVWSAMVPTPFVPNSDGPRHDLVEGSLEWCQMELNAQGYARPPLSVDGVMGRATEAALHAFQQAKGLPTLAALNVATINSLRNTSRPTLGESLGLRPPGAPPGPGFVRG
jgi:hypothetical protein